VAALSAPSSAPGDAVAVLERAISATSHPGHGPPTRPIDARITRLQRFRSTADPSRLPATKSTRPCGSRAPGVGAIRTSRSRSAARCPSVNRRSMSRAAVIVRITPPFGGVPLRRGARAEDLASLATTRSEDRTSGPGGHTLAKAVRLRALPVVWLIGALHFGSSCRCPVPTRGTSPASIPTPASRCQRISAS